MGIPFYFATLLKNHAGITSVVKKMEVDVLGIDFNCLIHRYLVDEHPITSVLDALEHILTDLCVAKHTIIAFDGLVPYGKIVQQRYRRFREKDSTGAFDRNQISPDTPYMRQLENAIIAQFPNVTLSPTQHPGEGEHKLFQLIRNLAPNNRKKVCIYGLDADLILLSLYNYHLSDSHSFWLLRESSEFNDPRLKHAEFSTLSIWRVLDAIPMDMEQYLALCVMCFGNDFMPNIGMFSLREGGYARALEIYKDSGNPNLLTSEGRRLFIEAASKIETETLVERVKLRKRPEERGIVGKDLTSIHYKYNIHILDGVRNIEPVVESFWKTFEWTMHYFKNNEVLDWGWYYPYPDAPLVGQMIEYPTSASLKECGLNYKIKDQLSFILPSKSLHKAKKKVMYVDEIYTETRNTWMKNYEWEMKPRISLPWSPTYDLTSVCLIETPQDQHSPI